MSRSPELTLTFLVRAVQQVSASARCHSTVDSRAIDLCSWAGDMQENDLRLQNSAQRSTHAEIEIMYRRRSHFRTWDVSAPVPGASRPGRDPFMRMRAARNRDWAEQTAVALPIAIGLLKSYNTLHYVKLPCHVRYYSRYFFRVLQKSACKSLCKAIVSPRWGGHKPAPSVSPSFAPGRRLL